MSIWNRLQKFFPNSLKESNRSEILLQMVITSAILWGLEKWGVLEKWDPPPKKEKPFKELHQQRTFPYSKDDDAPTKLQ